MPNRDDAWNLSCEYTQSESLRKHALAVEACVRTRTTTLIICLRIMGLYDVSVRHSFVRHFGERDGNR